MELKQFLDHKAKLYNQPSFIPSDPISIPHQYSEKEDIEISSFLTAIISWGRREMIIKSANTLMMLMDKAPYDFVMNAGKSELKALNGFYYRTFNADDLIFMIYALRNIYQHKGGLENIANEAFVKDGTIKNVIMAIRNALLETTHLKRSEKHLANPEAGSAAKRLNMFLRWMIRDDDCGVDFGLWKKIPAKALMCPLDVHSAGVARSLGLLKTKQTNWKSVEELTGKLKEFNPDDPVRYDFALFGLGVFANYNFKSGKIKKV